MGRDTFFEQALIERGVLEVLAEFSKEGTMDDLRLNAIWAFKVSSSPSSPIFRCPIAPTEPYIFRPERRLPVSFRHQSSDPRRRSLLSSLVVRLLSTPRRLKAPRARC